MREKTHYAQRLHFSAILLPEPARVPLELTASIVATDRCPDFVFNDDHDLVVTGDDDVWPAISIERLLGGQNHLSPACRFGPGLSKVNRHEEIGDSLDPLGRWQTHEEIAQRLRQEVLDRAMLPSLSVREKPRVQRL